MYAQTRLILILIFILECKPDDINTIYDNCEKTPNGFKRTKRYDFLPSTVCNKNNYVLDASEQVECGFLFILIPFF